MDGDAVFHPVRPGGGALWDLLGEQATALLSRWGREPWLGRIAPDRARSLYDWPRLNTILSEHRFDRSRLCLGGPSRVVTDGSGRIRQTELLAALRDGATLILNAANETSAPLRTACEALSTEFTCACQANLYACWGETRGFDVHWDDHDVLVVQSQGRKRWRLYGMTRKHPLIRNDPPDHLPPPAPKEELTLEAGDVLYLPRGYWHAAVGLGEPSLHLTIGLTRRTGSDFLHWLADHLLSEAAARRDLAFESGDAAVAAQIASLLSVAANRSPGELALAYRRHVEAAVRVSDSYSLPAIGWRETSPSPDDKLTLSPGAARLEDAPGTGSAVLSWRGAQFTVSDVLRPVLTRMINGEAVPVAELARSASPERAAEFVRQMVARGVFVLHSD